MKCPAGCGSTRIVKNEKGEIRCKKCGFENKIEEFKDITTTEVKNEKI